MVLELVLLRRQVFEHALFPGSRGEETGNLLPILGLEGPGVFIVDHTVLIEDPKEESQVLLFPN